MSRLQPIVFEQDVLVRGGEVCADAQLVVDTIRALGSRSILFAADTPAQADVDTDEVYHGLDPQEKIGILSRLCVWAYVGSVPSNMGNARDTRTGRSYMVPKRSAVF